MSTWLRTTWGIFWGALRYPRRTTIVTKNRVSGKVTVRHVEEQR